MITFKKGQISIAQLDSYVNKGMTNLAVNPLFIIFVYVQSALGAGVFTLCMIAITLMLYVNGGTDYQITLSLMIAAPIIPVILYLRFRRKVMRGN